MVGSPTWLGEYRVSVIRHPGTYTYHSVYLGKRGAFTTLHLFSVQFRNAAAIFFSAFQHLYKKGIFLYQFHTVNKIIKVDNI